MAELHGTLQEVIRRRLNPLFKIHEVVQVAALPRTASNKTMRRVLRASYAAPEEPHETTAGCADERGSDPDRRVRRRLRDCSAPFLGSVAIRAALQRAGLAGDQVDEVIMGNVYQAGSGPNPRGSPR